jgi:hypothetical protein
MQQVRTAFENDVQKRVMDKFQSVMIEAKGGQKNNLWTMYHGISFGIVWGDGGSRKAAAEPAGADDPGRWWPCIIGGHAYTNVVGVLCEPLLDGGCKRPWLTHSSRLQYLPAALNPTQNSTVVIEEIPSDEEYPAH